MDIRTNQRQKPLQRWYDSYCCTPLWTRASVVALWYAGIFTLSAVPAAASASTKEFVGGIELFNVVLRVFAHLWVFGVWSVLVFVAFAGDSVCSAGSASYQHYFAALATTALGGLADEIHQRYVPGRFFRWQDVATDTLGGVIALATLYVFSRRSSLAAHSRGNAPAKD
jgi:VanZ family protein